MDERKYMGKGNKGAKIPVAPFDSEMDREYFDFINEVKEEIRKQRLRVTLNANASMICLYWNIGNAVLNKQEQQGWGAKVIDRMSKDINDEFHGEPIFQYSRRCRIKGQESGMHIKQ